MCECALEGRQRQLVVQYELDPLGGGRAVRMVADRGEHQQGAAIERKARDPGTDRREPVTNLIRSLAS